LKKIENWKRKLEKKNLLAKGVETFITPLLKQRERKMRLRYRGEGEYPPTFIIGAPRSGSTLLYQTLVNTQFFIYINNFTHIFASCLFTGFELYHSFHKKEKEVNYTSNYGDTQKTGWQGPSECARFWYYYFPKSSSEPLVENILSEKGEAFYVDYINGLSNKYGKPFLFKNLSVGSRIPVIENLFQNARYVVIERDWYYNAQSIYLARKKKGISANEWWSLKPRGFEQLLGESQEKIAVRQVKDTRSQVEADLKRVSSERKIKVSYESLVKAPRETLGLIKEKFDLGNHSLEMLPQEFPNGNKVKVSLRTEQRLIQEIKKASS